MKLKEFTKIFFTDLEVVVRDRDVVVVPHTTADELALKPDFKDLREKEVFMVHVGKVRAIITLK